MPQELNGTLTNSANLVGTFGTTGGGGTNNYNDLTNKPQINGVELQGNKTTSNLNISYNDIGNKPTINGVMLQGNKTTSNLNISYNDLKNKPTLATVATSGSYDDLTNKPTIPEAQVNSDWNSTSGVSEILNKPTLAAVATSGDYDDLTNKPTIPAAQVNSDWNSTSGVSEILNKPTLAAVATSGSYSDLSGTPTIPVNSDFALSGLSDTDITTPTANQVLAYDNNGKVVNSEPIIRQYFIGTTSAYGNLALGTEFDSTNYVIVQATARNKTNTNTVYLANVYQNDVNKFGTTYGINVREIATNNVVASTSIEGYLWLARFKTA